MKYLVLWGLGRREEFDDANDAAERCDEIHADMIETWPELAGTGDAVLPRVIEVEAL